MNVSLSVGPRDLAKIALRLLGLVYLVDAVIGVPTWLATTTYEIDETIETIGYDPLSLQFSVVAGLVLAAAFGLFCLLQTNALIRWFFSDLAEEPATAVAPRLEKTGFAFIGLFIAAWSAVELLSAAATVVWYLGGDRRELLPDVAAQQWSSWLYAVAGVAIGVAVFQTAGRLAGYLARR